MRGDHKTGPGGDAPVQIAPLSHRRPEGAEVLFPWGEDPWQGLDATGEAATQALSLIGQRWNLLIVREVFSGVHRFAKLQDNLDISRPVLARRLRLLVWHGILERRAYAARPPRFEYRLTETGRALYPALAALIRWSQLHQTETRPEPVSQRPTRLAAVQARPVIE
jgi:DNA-binding HxlR family transcriptional regulator